VEAEKIMKKRRFVIAVVLMLFVMISAGCGSADLVMDQRIAPGEAMRMMTYYDVIILDVRELYEFNMGHIPNAVSLPIGEIRDAVAHMIPDKGQIILIYCQSGRRSADALGILVDMGYQEVFDFGGIIYWTGEVAVSSH